MMTSAASGFWRRASVWTLHDLDRLRRVSQDVVTLHHADAVNSLLTERVDGLLDQRQRRHREDDAVALVERALNDMRAVSVLPKPVGA